MFKYNGKYYNFAKWTTAELVEEREMWHYLSDTYEALTLEILNREIQEIKALQAEIAPYISGAVALEMVFSF